MVMGCMNPERGAGQGATTEDTGYM